MGKCSNLFLCRNAVSIFISSKEKKSAVSLHLFISHVSFICNLGFASRVNMFFCTFYRNAIDFLMMMF